MKKNLLIIVTALIAVGLAVCGFVFSDYSLSYNQKITLNILIGVCVSAIVFCFVVGELSGNNSQMDKLWSILPIAYVWIIAARGGFKLRLVLFALIATAWGIRLTINFARKGAYRLKFWEGEEDYRWAILRQKKPFTNRFVWALFNLFFISIYQNFLVLAMTLPALGAMESDAAFGPWDGLATALSLGFLALETIADEQQWAFHRKKKAMLSSGKKLEELDPPYNLGFNTTGLWGFMRHPNYLGEQGIWISLYLFLIGSGVANYGIFHWTLFGPMLIVLLFLGSSTLGESISSSKYPKYASYIKQCPKYFPLRRFNPERE